ncbi:hypothetical protein DPMN_041354 [Dreissena polymorpha]|uniref:Uncharacterized protein n=1 Tax=Dreissena polymorpha TaxID=45954 RepID=A0A9D4HW49_DREPO|nr:hypothetical protein DPMN_041354 [Dreissena polymorpha]
MQNFWPIYITPFNRLQRRLWIISGRYTSHRSIDSSDDCGSFLADIHHTVQSTPATTVDHFWPIYITPFNRLQRRLWIISGRYTSHRSIDSSDDCGSFLADIHHTVQSTPATTVDHFWPIYITPFNRLQRRLWIISGRYTSHRSIDSSDDCGSFLADIHHTVQSTPATTVDHFWPIYITPFNRLQRRLLIISGRYTSHRSIDSSDDCGSFLADIHHTVQSTPATTVDHFWPIYITPFNRLQRRLWIISGRYTSHRSIDSSDDCGSFLADIHHTVQSTPATTVDHFWPIYITPFNRLQRRLWIISGRYTSHRSIDSSDDCGSFLADIHHTVQSTPATTVDHFWPIYITPFNRLQRRLWIISGRYTSHRSIDSSDDCGSFLADIHHTVQSTPATTVDHFWPIYITPFNRLQRRLWIISGRYTSHRSIDSSDDCGSFLADIHHTVQSTPATTVDHFWPIYITPFNRLQRRLWIISGRYTSHRSIDSSDDCGSFLADIHHTVQSTPATTVDHFWPIYITPFNRLQRRLWIISGRYTSHRSIDSSDDCGSFLADIHHTVQSTPATTVDHFWPIYITPFNRLQRRLWIISGRYTSHRSIDSSDDCGSFLADIHHTDQSTPATTVDHFWPIYITPFNRLQRRLWIISGRYTSHRSIDSSDDCGSFLADIHHTVQSTPATTVDHFWPIYITPFNRLQRRLWIMRLLRYCKHVGEKRSVRISIFFIFYVLD